MEDPVQAIETMPAVAAEAAPMEEDAAEEDDDEDRLVIKCLPGLSPNHI